MRTKEELLAAYKDRQIKKHGSAEAAHKHKEAERAGVMKALSHAKALSQSEMSKDYGSNWKRNRHMPKASL